MSTDPPGDRGSGADRATEDEDHLLEWLHRRLERRGGSLVGDDGAVLDAQPGEDRPWTVTTDTQIEGVHFLPGTAPATLARRLLAVNLSDLAAMGARPLYAFLVVAAPAGFDHRAFFRALLGACQPHGLRLAGGDLTSHTTLTLVLTLIGERPLGGRWLRRAGGRPGHRLWLGGTVGEAAAGLELLRRGAVHTGRGVELPDEPALDKGLSAAARRAVRRHLAPRPQLELAAWLAEETSEGAAIDLSDGLARDLHRLCRASMVGAEVELEALPLAPRFQALCRNLDLDWRRLALGGGEDYVLLFSLPAGAEPPKRFGCRPIGTLRRERQITLTDAKRSQPLAREGWDHLASDS